MCVQVCACVRGYMCICVHVYVYVYIHVCVFMYIGLCVYVHTCVCTCVFSLCVCMTECAQIYVHIDARGQPELSLFGNFLMEPDAQ